MKTIIKLTFIFLSIILLPGCNKWLDVRPKSEVGQEQLFKDEQGYINALYGVYANMSKTDLYGGDLPVILDVLGKVWTLADNHDFNALKKYEYTNSEATNYMDKIWERLYYCIMLSNNILDHLEKDDPSRFEYYNYIKGEALAIRAFLHYEILKIYAPNIKDMPEYMSIPYKRLYSNDIEPQYKVNEIIGFILEDLKAAKELLSKDVIRTNTPEFVEYRNNNDNNNDEDIYHSKFLLDRKFRMNYYGVVATMARIYMDMGNKTEAFDCASEVIKSGQYRYIRQEDFVDDKEEKRKRDLMFNDEIIFGLYSIHIDGYAKNRYTSSSVDKRIYIPAETNGDDTFKKFFSYTGDIRRKFYLTTTNMGSTQMQLDRRIDDNDLSTKRIRMITLHEMCMIVVEANTNKAVELLTPMSESREIILGITQNSTRDEILTFIAEEYRREYIGEGQFWNFFKRNNKEQFLDLMQTGIGSSIKHLVLPLPASEIEYGRRVSEIWNN